MPGIKYPPDDKHIHECTTKSLKKVQTSIKSLKKVFQLKNKLVKKNVK